MPVMRCKSALEQLSIFFISPHFSAFTVISWHFPAFPGTPRHSSALPGILLHSSVFPGFCKCVCLDVVCRCDDVVYNQIAGAVDIFIFNWHDQSGRFFKNWNEYVCFLFFCIWTVKINCYPECGFHTSKVVLTSVSEWKSKLDGFCNWYTN